MTLADFIQDIPDPVFDRAGIRLSLLREDLRHPLAQGNKFHKLKHNLAAARQAGHRRLLTFGGAYSNHIHATASAGAAAGFETVGVIRGERPAIPNPTLRHAESCGMRLHFVSRTDYRQKATPDFLAGLRAAFGDAYILPEGGTNALAIQGCEDWAGDILRHLRPDYCLLPVGTGGSMAGLVRGFGGKVKTLGFSSLKGDFLKGDVARLINDDDLRPHWDIMADYHFGGYARHRPPLIAFINAFLEDWAIPLDPVYTGKMMYGISDLAAKGYFPKGSHLLAIHTGGLQGVKGFNERHGGLLREI